jgi:hypothetical protein
LRRVAAGGLGLANGANGHKNDPRVANVGDDPALFANRDRTLFDAPVAEDDEPCVVVGHRARFAVMVMVR